MIVRSKKCIFVHIPKVAGQSIETVLRAAASASGSVEEDFGLRKRRRGEAGPERLAHLTGIEYRDLGYVSREEFQTFFKFAFVRNPWDRAYSIYRHFGLEDYVGYEYFLRHILCKGLRRKQYWFVRPQCDFVLDANGEVCVDFLGRFETLDKDFAHAADVLGLNESRLPHVNRGSSRAKFKKLRALKRYPMVLSHAREIVRTALGRVTPRISPEALAIIDELYKCDIEQFDYQSARPAPTIAG